METSYSKSEVKTVAIQSVSIRIEETMLSELGFVAAYEGRTLNSQVLVLIRDAIKSFEAKNGPIEMKIPPESNGKPERKKKQ